MAVYSGYYLRNEKEVFFDNMTKDQREDIHKNWISFNDTFMIDVPPEYTDITKYRASLAHKVLH